MKKLRLREIKRFKIIRMVNRKVRTWFQVGQPSPFCCCTCHWRGHKGTLIPARPLQPGTDMQWRGGWSVPCKPLRSPAVLPMLMWVCPARQGAPLRARSNPPPITCPHIPTWGFESGRGDICLCDCAATVLGKKSFSFGEIPCCFCLPKSISELGSQAPLRQGRRCRAWALP